MMSSQKEGTIKRERKNIFLDSSKKRTTGNNKKAKNFCYSFYLLADDGKIFFNSSFIFPSYPPPTGTRCEELLSPGRSVFRNFFWFQSRKWERLEISSFVCSRKLHKIKRKNFLSNLLPCKREMFIGRNKNEVSFFSHPVFDMAIVHNTTVVTQGWWRT